MLWECGEKRGALGRRAMEMKEQGSRKIGRPERRMLNRMRDDFKEMTLSGAVVYDRASQWRRNGNTIKRKKT